MLTGFVERIDVMRTVVRTDKGVPVAVPNRSITEMIVSNESRLGRSNVAANFKVPPLICKAALSDAFKLICNAHSVFSSLGDRPNICNSMDVWENWILLALLLLKLMKTSS